MPELSKTVDLWRFGVSWGIEGFPNMASEEPWLAIRFCNPPSGKEFRINYQQFSNIQFLIAYVSSIIVLIIRCKCVIRINLTHCS